jgi:hypothetical protein
MTIVGMKIIPIKSKKRLHLFVKVHKDFVFLLFFASDSSQNIAKSNESPVFIQQRFDLIQRSFDWKEVESLPDSDEVIFLLLVYFHDP